MKKGLTLNGAETHAQFIEEDKTYNVKITTKINVKWLRIVYQGNAEFKYFLDGKKTKEINREFALDIFNQEKNHINNNPR